uniref:Uncharacterized protein n=1 Tax=Gossypium raimondii TaxID=29730 RepID=A0A0D2SLQ2_GOSRA|nr:hypothetical protein B456_N009700 [Gossypium raimondii]
MMNAGEVMHNFNRIEEERKREKRKRIEEEERIDFLHKMAYLLISHAGFYYGCELAVTKSVIGLFLEQL